MATIGTVHNGGIVLGTGTYTGALTITSSGAVDNTSGDAIYGPNSQAWTVFNDGTVQGSTHAIFFKNGGYVNNGTGGFTTALITGGSYGVYVQAAAATVTNSGTIFGTSNALNLEHGGIVTNSGYIHSTGGSVFINTVAGTVTNSGTIAGSNGVVLQAGGTVIDSGTITGSGATAIGFGAGGSVLALESGYKITSTGTAAVSVTGSNKLELLGATGAVTVNFNKANAGFTNFTTAAFGPTGGNNEILQITNTAALPGTISGFTLLHEIVDLTQFTSPGSAVVNFNSVTNQLTITEGAQSVTLQLGSGSYAGVSWTPGTDSSTGTAITAMCFVRGTRILTPDGEVPVEELAIGGKVATLSGAARRIKWIGRRAYDGRFTAGNLGVLPVRIAAGALADGVPSRDLRVSPEHALHIDGALAPARLLVNGATITQAEDVEQVEYFHIELDTHDVILAEGAPAETYIDCDNRFMFHNAGEFARLYPEEPLPGWQSCALRLEEGAPELVGIRAGIARRAGLPEVTAPAPETGTDHLPNPAMTGALIGIVGQGGALPTGWHVYSAADLNYAVVGHGEEDGIDYVDLRIFGTPSATTNANQIFFTGSSEMRAGIGQRWSAAAYVQLCAGSLENVRGVEIGANLNDADGKYSSWFRSTAFTPLQEALGRRRFARSGTIADRNAAYLQPLLQVGAMAGQAIDLTLRIGHPRAVLLDPGSFGENPRAAA